MIRKLDLKGETLEFKITNRTIFDIDEKFENFADVINGVMYEKNLYNNALKVLSSSCITKREEGELTVDELIDKLTPKQITQELVPFVINLYFDYRGFKTDSKKEEKEPDNIKKN